MSRRVLSRIVSHQGCSLLDALMPSSWFTVTQLCPSQVVQRDSDSGHIIRNSNCCSSSSSSSNSSILFSRGHKVDSSKQHQKEHLHLKHCWSCDFHVQKGGLVCWACDKIQPVEKGVNFFNLFDLPDVFDLDVAALEKRYKSLQWQIHPDKTVGRTAEEQHFSAQQAAILNHAYSILKAPLTRANYLLLRKGAAREEDAEDIILEPELLGQVLELREEIEDASDPNELKHILSGVQSQEADVVSQLATAFAEDDLSRAKSLVTQLSYITKLIETATQKLP